MAIIEKRGNSYSIRVSAGYNVQGRQLRKNFTWTPDPSMTEKQLSKELQRQIVHFEDLAKSGCLIDSSTKFEIFSQKWIALHAEKSLAPKTIQEYKRQLVRINQAIGHIRIDKLQPANLIEFYDKLGDVGIRKDTRYQATDRLMVIMKAKRLNATRVAILAQIGATTVQEAVKGVRVSKKSADAISGALGVLTVDLFSPVERAPALSGNTILRHHRLVSSILSTAVEWQVIPSNPATRVRTPRAEKNEPKFLDEVQARSVIELLQQESILNRTMVTLLIYTGIRRGELCGLKWSDLDPDKQLLHIRRAVQYLPEIGLFEKMPKSSTSIRVIRLSPVAIQLLKDYRKIQAADQLSCGDQWMDLDLVFTRWNGSYFNPDDLTKWFNGFVRRNGLPQVTPHSLRHTNATLMIAAGTDLRTVSKRLGHAQTSTTMNIYSHAIMSADEAAADTLGDILNPSRNADLGRAK